MLRRAKGKRASTYRRHPGGSRGTDVATTRIPFDIGKTVVLHSGDEADAGSGVVVGGLLLSVEVEIPEVDIELGVGAEGGDEDVASLG